MKGIEGGDGLISTELTDPATQKRIRTSVALSVSFKPLSLSHREMTVALGSSFVIGVTGGSLSVQTGILNCPFFRISL